MPARFGPVGLGINGRVRHYALFAVLFMPHAPYACKVVLSTATARQLVSPGHDHSHQVTAETTESGPAASPVSLSTAAARCDTPNSGR